MQYDYVLVGGGLQNALLTLAIRHVRPEARIALVESGLVLGGNHTWSFHQDDVPPDAQVWVEPLVARRWSSYRVVFPELERTFDTHYAAVSCDRLDRVVTRALTESEGCALHLGVAARSVLSNEVYLDDGRVLHGKLVVDARGPVIEPLEGAVGYQKFVGLELLLRRPMQMLVPTLIDADVPQHDGFRFVYTLPFEPTRVLVEDTYYSESKELDVERIVRGILDRAHSRGLEVDAIARTETGVLPLPLERMPAPSRGGPLVAGYQGGFFHPTTGYSFPLAVRLARHVASCAPEDVFGAHWDVLVARHERQARFAMMLNRLLFGAIAADERWRVLERFHRLPEATIRRFYALSTTATDRARIVCGRPPRGMSLRSALARMVSA